MYEPVSQWWSGLSCETRSVVCAATTCAAWQTCNWGWSRWYERTKNQSYVEATKFGQYADNVERRLWALESQMAYLNPIIKRNTESLNDLHEFRDEYVAVLAHGLDEGETLDTLLGAIEAEGGYGMFVHIAILSERLHAIECQLLKSRRKSRSRKRSLKGKRSSSLPRTSRHRQLNSDQRNLSLPIKPTELPVED